MSYFPEKKVDIQQYSSEIINEDRDTLPLQNLLF